MDRFKRRNGLSVCLFVLGAFSLYHCSDTTYNKALKGATPSSQSIPNPPILTEEAAIEFAKTMEAVANNLQSAQQQANYEGWIYEAKYKEDVHMWEVSVRSKGTIIPSYICTILFTKDGELMGNEPECGFVK